MWARDHITRVVVTPSVSQSCLREIFNVFQIPGVKFSDMWSIYKHGVKNARDVMCICLETQKIRVDTVPFLSDWGPTAEAKGEHPL
jgi:hypothetical protein